MHQISLCLRKDFGSSTRHEYFLLKIMKFKDVKQKISRVCDSLKEERSSTFHLHKKNIHKCDYRYL